MAPNPLTQATTPTFQDVLDALNDPDCRTLIRALDEPRSATELAEVTDVPRSTAYEKVATLRDAGLVREFTEIRRDGSHTAKYERSFDEVRVTVDDDGELHANVRRTDSTDDADDADDASSNDSPDECLAAMWSEVRSGT